ncbi:invasion associated locus B family protein [Poseidonocella sedimentorum]|uniref:Invasion protein IalB, involved in pathogenesis n=1 Tax=Poseidonocella sedimentorum TaxID=871652 RepID=A0A1I6CND5_9RHOB|nr:invasion associated locus B family protein [Poseidonocella sedimentorum]SFQ94656.1 Invasion protein IalB, involved in pathogenesis [Poseidonocella sedimentorum]
MLNARPLFASLALIAAAGLASAQDSTPESSAPAEVETPAQTEGAGDPGLSMGAPAGPQLGQAYTAETHGDWELRCIRSEQETDPCQLYQLLRDSAGNSVAEISLFRLEGNARAEAGANIVVPLETALQAGASVSVDGGQARQYPFSFCNQVGCYARIGLTPTDIASFKRGAAAQLSIVPFAAPDQTVDLSISLSGFTAGYDNVSALQTQ